MDSSVHLLPPMESVSAGRPEKRKKLMSEGSDEENRKSVGEGSEEDKMDSSLCPCGNCYCGMTEEEKQYKDTLNGLFDCEGEPEEDSDGDMMVGGIVAYLRGKFDLEGPDAEDWRRMADYSNLALEKYKKDNGTNYVLVEVVKVNSRPIEGIKYYITFTAKDAADGVPKFFQAIVLDMIETGLEVGLCRLKPTNF